MRTFGWRTRRFAVIGALLSAVACGDLTPRVLIVGIDGATRKVIDPLMEAGQLPTLQGLEREGSVGALRPDLPILSPRIWTSVATGRDALAHGIEDWVRQDADGTLHLYESSDRRVHALWNILSDAGRTVAVVNWLQTQPPERINGVMVSDHAIPGTYQDRLPVAAEFAMARSPEIGKEGMPEVTASSLDVVFTSPPEWAPRVAKLSSAEAPLTDVPNPFLGASWEDVGSMADYLRSRYENDEHVARIALAIDAELTPDLMMVYLPGIDRVSHFMWNGFELSPDLSEERRSLMQLVAPKHRQVLEDYYRFVDGLLGRILARFGPDDLVLVMSDHGFEAGVRPVGMHETEDAREGVVFARGPGIAAGGTLSSTLTPEDVAPTVLGFFGLPLAQDMPGVPAFGPGKPIERVLTYDTTPIERERSGGGSTGDEIMKNLRALGYVE